MRSFSEQMMVAVPGFLALLMISLFTMKVHWLNVSLVPNVVWVMSLVVGAMFRIGWPLWLVFALGLMQDVLFGTPLGSQAVLAVMLTELVRAQAARQQFQQFRVRWLEATGALMVWHLLLWMVMHLVEHAAPPLRNMLLAGLISGLWFPLVYGAMRLMLREGVRS